MTVKQIISHLKKSPLDAWYYIQGSVRIYCYRRKNLKWLIRKHIAEQYLWRRDVAAQECFYNGSCICCGCDTPDLFFAKKECSAEKFKHCVDTGRKKCYPELKSRLAWRKFKDYISKTTGYNGK